MKRISLSLLFTIIAALSLASVSANSDLELLKSENTQLKQEIKQLKNTINGLDEKNYIRIPNKDFDDIISSKAINIIDEKLDMKLGNIELLVGFAATIILTIIGFAFNQAITNTKRKIQIDVLEELNETLTKKIKEMEERFISEKEEIFYLTEFKAIKDNTKSYTDKTHNELQSKKLEDLLEKVTKGKDQYSLIPQIVDELVYIYYLNYKTSNIDRLLSTYGSNYTFSGPTWVNGALAYAHDYLSYGETFSKNQCLKYIEKALTVVPGYGEALALKLYISMKDLDQASNNEERDSAINKCRIQLKNITESPSYSAFETLKRMRKDEKIWAKYITALHEHFPVEMNEMKRIAEEYETGKMSPSKVS
ncbi:MAG: hypothetical protein HRT47_03280 [Candidatus Caenarcaniphilales bacterium]|nr:hypothetical protein [Candidatus Caenarcaniphilales bacterium]